mmetsp:Transcript_18917/g.47249  ORF Transcript_18917/g.47249 Transcript_18917/m.47249 type:complete len:431 (+) Transcript_18917:326-1618(+)|eukprot:CAMPEP_0178987122 /NCGR_PEP_ID=MMETSP0795-20121207/3085_1 /TAXON_ID=88552 /ORGANISM="Amoebophrya sp., Strain Ameob2" /LENGTH=430 /DNA_ID=CAMNT_0020678261 /DNA_START=234 /DNA_END=1526 /DNA_ORIENTATION=-
MSKKLSTCAIVLIVVGSTVLVGTGVGLAVYFACFHNKGASAEQPNVEQGGSGGGNGNEVGSTNNGGGEEQDASLTASGTQLVVLDGFHWAKRSRFLPTTPRQGLVHCGCRKVADAEPNWDRSAVDAGRRVRCQFYHANAQHQQTGGPGKKWKKAAPPSSAGEKLSAPVSWRELVAGLSENDHASEGIFRKSVLTHLAAVSTALETSELADYGKNGDKISIRFDGRLSGGVRIETNQYLKDGSNAFEFVLFTSSHAPKRAAERNDYNKRDAVNGDGLLSNELPHSTAPPGGVVTKTLGEDLLMVIPEPRFVEGANKHVMKQCSGMHKNTWNCYANLGDFVTSAPPEIVERVFQRLGDVLNKNSKERAKMATVRGEELSRGAANFATHGGGVPWLHIRVGSPGVSAAGAVKYWASPYKKAQQTGEEAKPLLK